MLQVVVSTAAGQCVPHTLRQLYVTAGPSFLSCCCLLGSAAAAISRLNSCRAAMADMMQQPHLMTSTAALQHQQTDTATSAEKQHLQATCGGDNAPLAGTAADDC